MKKMIVVLLVLLAAYWMFDHYPPLPLSHQSLGLYQHGIHRLLGVVFLVAAVAVGLFWKPKKK